MSDIQVLKDAKASLARDLFITEEVHYLKFIKERFDKLFAQSLKNQCLKNPRFLKQELLDQKKSVLQEIALMRKTLTALEDLYGDNGISC